MARDGVLDQPVREEVEELTAGTKASGPSQVQVVVDLAVRSLSVAAPTHQALVVGVTTRDLAG
jgi:hypothetical protein